MKVTVELTDPHTKFIINNLYPLYLHDLSEIWGWKPNKYGVLYTSGSCQEEIAETKNDGIKLIFRFDHGDFNSEEALYD
ncbi:hypothetical protein J2TS6_28700 [Paenibacillus albilobatus]|uniref:Uncharacterized protein n=1 Tax=Paenibacillus albilobatus TaxID=2716884 RepID=A0A919XFN7_9BACL|nr:hypothetical protein J2TS6_28700 [Paenibacillus albilobatus]